jgi:surfactin synthase thioesterase subunit
MTPVELVCFHHAGGGSGRESHCDEPRYVDADACVRGLADELDDLLSRPHVLLGHTWALRCRIQRHQYFAPRALADLSVIPAGVYLLEDVTWKDLIR